MKINYYTLVFFTGAFAFFTIGFLYFLKNWFNLPWYGFVILFAVIIPISIGLSRIGDND